VVPLLVDAHGLTIVAIEVVGGDADQAAVGLRRVGPDHTEHADHDHRKERGAAPPLF
jgi:hypothetical protein